MQRLQTPDLYNQLTELPENLTGEILNGQLYTNPRPSGKHVSVATNLSIDIGSPYQRGKGGPGGWRILVEPEVHFVLDTEVVVPDVAGWRKERLPEVPESHKFMVVPDWVCEIYSPSSENIDRKIKMPLYARFGVSYLWMVHPIQQTLEAFKLHNGNWQLQGAFENKDEICVEPFESISIKMHELMD